MNRSALPPLLLLLACAALPGCITDPVTGRSVIGAPVSEAEETQMGQSYRPAITQEYSGPYPDGEAQQYLGSIVMRIAQHSVRSDLPWTFTILNTSVPNAFAVPGGQVFMTRGLITKLNDEAEFAVVMGHEIGHVEHRHSVQAMGRDSLIGIGASVLASKAGEQYGDVIGLGAQAFSMKYSRDQERESDVRGVEHSHALGYDPREGADVFRIFLKMKADQGGATPEFLSSHPADEERIRSVLALSAEKDPRLAGTQPVQGLVISTQQFQSIVGRMKAAQQVYDRYDAAMANVARSKGSEASLRAALTDVEAAARALPNHALLSSTTGKILLALKRDADAEPWLERAASMNQGLSDPDYLLAVLASRRSRWDDAVSRATRALQIFPGDFRASYVRGDAHRKAGRSREAQADFQRVVQSAPKDSREYRDAAQALGVAAPAAQQPTRAPAQTKPRPARR